MCIRQNAKSGFAILPVSGKRWSKRFAKPWKAGGVVGKSSSNGLRSNDLKMVLQLMIKARNLIRALRGPRIWSRRNPFYRAGQDLKAETETQRPIRWGSGLITPT